MKKKKTVLTLDELVFRDRNTEYGAYALRRDYPRRLSVAFCFSLSVFFFTILILWIRPKVADVLPVKLDITEEQYSKIVPYDPGLFNPGSYKAQSPPVALPTQEKPEEVSQEVIIQEDESTASVQTNVTDNVNTNNTSGGQGNAVQGNSNGEGNAPAGEGLDGDYAVSADVFPQFPGGSIAMQEFIMHNLKYPESSNVHGSIHLLLYIDSSGQIREVKVVKGLQAELDKDLVRVVKMMPPWNPAKRSGRAISVRCLLPVVVHPDLIRNKSK